MRIDILRLPTLNSEEPIIAPVQTAGELEIIAGGAAQRDDAALHLALRDSGALYLPGFSSARNRSWREPSWVTVDLPLAQLDALSAAVEAACAALSPAPEGAVAVAVAGSATTLAAMTLGLTTYDGAKVTARE